MFWGASTLLIFAVWFTSTPFGHNKLGNVVSKMCKDATCRANSAITVWGPQQQHVDWKKESQVNWLWWSVRATEISDLYKGIRDLMSLTKLSIKLSIRRIRRRKGSRVLVKKRKVDQLVDDEVKRFCQDDNNATVKGSNSVVFQNCSFVISKDFKFS